MKKILCFAIFAIASVAAFAAPEEIVKIVEDYLDHGTYIKAVFKNGEVKLHGGADSNGWFDIDDKKITIKPTHGITSLVKDDAIYFDKWDISSDERGNIVLTQK